MWNMSFKDILMYISLQFLVLLQSQHDTHKQQAYIMSCNIPNSNQNCQKFNVTKWIFVICVISTITARRSTIHMTNIKT